MNVTPLTFDVVPVSSETSQPADSFKRFNHTTGALAIAMITTVASASLVPTSQPIPKYEGKLWLSGGANHSSEAGAESAVPNISAVPSIDDATQAQILWSSRLLAPVIERIQDQYPDFSYEHLSQGLDITPGAGGVEISYQDTDARRVRAVLKQLAQTYQEYSQERPAENRQALLFIQQQVAQLQQQLTLAQEKAQSFQQQHSTNLFQLGQQLSERRHILAQRQQDLESQLAEAQTLYRVLQKQMGFQSEDPNASDLPLSQFQTVAAQLATELSSPQPDDSALQSLEQQYQQLFVQVSQTIQQPLVDRLIQLNVDSQIDSQTDRDNSQTETPQDIVQIAMLTELREAASQVQMLEISSQTIAQAQSSLNQQIKQWATTARQADELQLELQLATQKLNFHLTKQSEFQTKQSQLQTYTQRQAAPSPQIQQVAEGGLTLSESQRDLGLGFVLCFMLVVWAMTVWRGAKQPEALVCIPLSDVQSYPRLQSQPASLPLPMVWSNSQKRRSPADLAVLMLKAA